MVTNTENTQVYTQKLIKSFQQAQGLTDDSSNLTKSGITNAPPNDYSVSCSPSTVSISTSPVSSLDGGATCEADTSAAVVFSSVCW